MVKRSKCNVGNSIEIFFDSRQSKKRQKFKAGLNIQGEPGNQVSTKCIISQAKILLGFMHCHKLIEKFNLACEFTRYDFFDQNLFLASKRDFM